MVQDLESLVLRIGNAKGRFRVISTEIQPKMTLSQVLEKYQIPFNFRIRVASLTWCRRECMPSWFISGF